MCIVGVYAAEPLPICGFLSNLQCMVACCSLDLPCPCSYICLQACPPSQSLIWPGHEHPSDSWERQVGLTLPRSRMKQSPSLKLSQDTGTSVARTTRRPFTWKSLCTCTSLGTTCLNPEATPPFCGVRRIVLVKGGGLENQTGKIQD